MNLFISIAFLFLSCFAPLNSKPSKKIIFKEFDGVSVNGDWRKQYGAVYHAACEWNQWKFESQPTYGKMYHDGGYGDCPAGGNNQHVVRYDKTIDQQRPYTIECDFMIDTVFLTDINSFCVNFNVQRGMREDDKINCWSVNLDIHDRKSGKYSVKKMGFADLGDPKSSDFRQGYFKEILPAEIGGGALAAPELNHFKIEVNRRLDGSFALKWVTVTLSDKNGIMKHFEQDYSNFPFQPDPKKPVRIGFNTHATNWTINNLIVYYETKY